MKKNIVRKGFTLIELMIVVSIIGILSAALLPNLKGATGRARDAQRKVAMNQVVSELENYRIDNDHYPVGHYCIGTADDSSDLKEFDAYFDKIPEASKSPAITGPCDKNIGYIGTANGYTLYMAIEAKKGDKSIGTVTDTPLSNTTSLVAPVVNALGGQYFVITR